MNKEELRNLLHQEYKTENWEKVTRFVFSDVSYLKKPQEIPYNDKRVLSFKQIGNVKLKDAKNLAMFEVKVAKNVNLTANRVALRKLVAPLIDQERNHGVLVIYEQGGEEYRFTFTAKSTQFSSSENEFIDKETDAKRYTYILGKNESCKTAANRFWELSSQKEKATIEDVEAAFSVERLNREFFGKYKVFYEDFVQHITGKRFEKEKGKWIEKTKGNPSPQHVAIFKSNDKQARNFVKLLLGRLVFIQFLQKKGWMGVAADSKQWKNGDREFLLNLFKTAKNKDKFHSQYLYPLFYKAFNAPDRENDVFSLTGNRVPYLNGGLFENEYGQTDKMDFPSSFFENLLEFFGQYNFTIDENDPLDHEVGIDPEMLGHIFENLLEDNRDKGAFYTPKPIVQYMCQESLIQYLKTYIKQNDAWPTIYDESVKLEVDLQNFVRKKNGENLTNDYDQLLATALRDVKICDPAIGSGAFPMGLLNEIFYCIDVLHHASPDVVGEVWQMDDWAPDIVKKNIIQHSIYGVDIDKGAVDIARLRFWLSLIVHEKEPYPLPNLDFKIMQGNSLLESYEGIDLSKISSHQMAVTEVELNLFGNAANSQARIFDTKYIESSNITDLVDDYFDKQKPTEKQKLKQEIDAIIHNHIDFNLEFAENKILINIEDIQQKIAMAKAGQRNTDRRSAQNLKAQNKFEKELERAKSNLKSLNNARKSLHDLQNRAERPYFLWHLFFKDVFDSGGFDIVIGNPPYIQLQKMNKDVDLLEKANYRTFERTGDIYCLFYELACNVLKKEGTLTYITSNKWMRSAYGEALRRYFIENTNPLSIIDFGGYQVFEAATVDTNIMLAQKSAFENNIKTCVLAKGFSLNKMSDYFRQNHTVSTTFTAGNSWVVLTPIEQKIKDKIEKAGKPLKEWEVQINYGIKTGFNDAYIISEETKAAILKKSPKSAEIIRPILRGRDIKKYSKIQIEQWIINAHNGIKSRNVNRVNVENYPAVFEHLKLFEKELNERLDKGDHWTNLRNCAYLDDLEKEKLVWLELTDHPNFTFDNSGVFINNTIFFMTGSNLKYLMAYLNSKPCEWYFDKIAATSGAGTRRWIKLYLDQIYVPEPTRNQEKNVIMLAEAALDNPSTDLLKKIDRYFYGLLELNEAEVQLIEASIL